MTLTKHNIEALIMLCLSGNQLAQLEIYNRYYKAMYNTSFNKNKKNEDVALDDVLYKIEDHQGVDTTTEFTSVKAKQILDTLNTLKSNYRIALTLNLIEGYDYEEISEVMQISYANCRTTISRAKESLRKKLEQLN